MTHGLAMFNKRKKSKIDYHLNAATEYLKVLSENSKRPDGVQYSSRPGVDNAEQADNLAKIRQYDRYSADAISKAMFAFSEDSDAKTLTRELNENRSVSFVECLFYHMNRKNLKSTAVYKAAHIDRRLFSKIISDKYYQPSKDTAVSIAFALELSLSEAKDLLARAGFTLSHSSKRDMICEYFMQAGEYKLHVINEVLYQLGERTLSR